MCVSGPSGWPERPRTPRVQRCSFKRIIGTKRAVPWNQHLREALRDERVNPLSYDCVFVREGVHACMREHDAGGRQQCRASSSVRQMCPKPGHVYGNGSDRIWFTLHLSWGENALVSFFFAFFFLYVGHHAERTFLLHFVGLSSLFFFSFLWQSLKKNKDLVLILCATQGCFGWRTFSLCPCRYLESGGHPLHAGLWSAPLPGGQRQRDAHYDHGLQIHSASKHLPCVSRVSNTHAHIPTRMDGVLCRCCIFHACRCVKRKRSGLSYASSSLSCSSLAAAVSCSAGDAALR